MTPEEFKKLSDSEQQAWARARFDEISALPVDSIVSIPNWEFIAIMNVSYFPNGVNAMRDSNSSARYDSWVAETFPEVHSLTAQVHERYAAAADANDLFAAIRKLPAPALIRTWVELTHAGIDKIDFVKYIHSNLAEDVLNVFGVPDPTKKPKIRKIEE